MAGRLCGAWEATLCGGKGVTREGPGPSWPFGEGSGLLHLPGSPGSEWAGRTSRLGWCWAPLGPGVLPARRWPLLGTCRHSPCWDLWRERGLTLRPWGWGDILGVSLLVVTSGTKFILHILTKGK